MTIEITNEEQLNEIIEALEAVKSKAAKIGTLMIKLEGEKGSIDEDDIKFGDWSGITADYEVYIGCGDYERKSLTIPSRYLFEDEWEQQFKDKIAERRAAEERKRQQEIEKRQKAAEEKRKQEYLKLKKEFEGK